MRSLPPFDGLVALEATLRHNSVTRAAEELGLTQSAVSHRLRKLEDFTGAILVARTPGGVRATPAGSAVAAELGTLLDSMADLRARGRAATPAPALRVGVGAAFAQYWLVPRLKSFTTAHPDMKLDMIQLESGGEARTSDLDVTIHWERIERVRTTSTRQALFREQVFPVCHPRLLPELRPLRDARQLKTMPLLHKGRAGDGSGAEWAWSTWFDRLELGRPPALTMRFDNIATALAAALQGHGVVLARSLLVADALADGRLRRVLSTRWDMRSSKAHMASWSAAVSGDGRVRTFVGWLKREMSADITGKNI
ncbi:LysR substrate-binding domain-containing protein [Terrarubrum flagellatum]|uniref:LysR substrate-binding domain-containing protein n=1 Tax=Terrirubrum flagellatum TaxID=2895980 RepID=UPI003145512D